MYAIVRCGGRQEKAAVDDVLTVDTLPGEVGSSVTLPAVLVVDDGKVISDPAELRRYQVTAEIMGTIAGPKINIVHFRNKTGYRRRLGHRQRYTQVKITSIAADQQAASAKAGQKAASTRAGQTTASAKGGQKAASTRAGQKATSTRGGQTTASAKAGQKAASARAGQKAAAARKG